MEMGGITKSISKKVIIFQFYPIVDLQIEIALTNLVVHSPYYSLHRVRGIFERVPSRLQSTFTFVRIPRDILVISNTMC
jgi:hypothetical protein